VIELPGLPASGEQPLQRAPVVIGEVSGGVVAGDPFVVGEHRPEPFGQRLPAMQPADQRDRGDDLGAGKDPRITAAAQGGARQPLHHDDAVPVGVHQPGHAHRRGMLGEDLVHADLVPLPVPPARIAVGQHLDDHRLVTRVPGSNQRLTVVAQHLFGPYSGELGGQGGQPRRNPPAGRSSGARVRRLVLGLC
jgi:hypothetical protein